MFRKYKYIDDIMVIIGEKKYFFFSMVILHILGLLPRV